MSYIIKRKLQRTAWCRGCLKRMENGTDVVNIPSYEILLCLDCAKLIGNLVNSYKIEQNPIIWGDGWYAMLSEYDNDNIWYVAPKKFFEEKGHCPDGWDWEIPEGMDSDDLENFIDENGCEPNPPKGFQYCIESGMSCVEDWTLEEQKNKLREAGFIVDNVPLWHWNRKVC